MESPDCQARCKHRCHYETSFVFNDGCKQQVLTTQHLMRYTVCMKKILTLKEKQTAMQNRWEVKGETRTPEEFRWKLTYSERRVLSVLQSQGNNDIIRYGWPDFGVVVDGRLVGVEVKRGPNDRLNDAQKAAHKLLKKAGIEVLVVEDDGYLCSILRQLKGKVSL